MDHLMLIISVITLIIIASTCVAWIRRFSRTTKERYHQHLPAVRITNLSTLKAEDTITFTPELENTGPGVAYDFLLQLSGWDGNFSVKAFHPKGPDYQKHSVPIVLGPNAPIRTKLLSRCYLRLAYRDRWAQRYECWYPVSQVPNVDSRLYGIQINLTQPEFTEPHPSVNTMWKLLRKIPAHH
ncbi:MAG: hypothetical protein KF682_19805 [Nitrospira sp.]|nr:hypothetical protein [Nitrospira sp.]